LKKKIVLLAMFLTVFGLVSVSAETWKEFMNRVTIMTFNIAIGTDNGYWLEWSTDKWGALLATAGWLEDACEDISKNAPGLTQNERDGWRELLITSRMRTKELVRLYNLAITNQRTRDTVLKRVDYWLNHLNNGGTINFN